MNGNVILVVWWRPLSNDLIRGQRLHDIKLRLRGTLVRG